MQHDYPCKNPNCINVFTKSDSSHKLYCDDCIAMHKQKSSHNGSTKKRIERSLNNQQLNEQAQRKYEQDLINKWLESNQPTQCNSR